MTSNTENNKNDSAPDSQEDALHEQQAAADVVDVTELEDGETSVAEAAETDTTDHPAVAESVAVAGEPEAEEPEAEAAPEGPNLTVVPVAELTNEHIRNVLEAALFAADEALTVDRLVKLFVPGELAEEGGRAQVRDALADLEAACENRGFELKKVASGYRMQVRQQLSPWVSRLWEEKPPRYTRALLETMALIAYKQPATRGDIEEVRGVAVSSSIMRTLLERGWIREVGQRDVPGRPSMYGTTKEFLDYFNLSSLDQLPSLPEIRELVEPAQIPEEPAVELVDEQAAVGEGANEGADHELQGVDMPDIATEASIATGAEENSASAPVFADNEVLVVSESAEVELQQASELTTLPSAESQE